MFYLFVFDGNKSWYKKNLKSRKQLVADGLKLNDKLKQEITLVESSVLVFVCCSDLEGKGKKKKKIGIYKRRGERVLCEKRKKE